MGGCQQACREVHTQVWMIGCVASKTSNGSSILEKKLVHMYIDRCKSAQCTLILYTMCTTHTGTKKCVVQTGDIAWAAKFHTDELNLHSCIL